MNGVALALTLATLGVDYSYRTTEEGQLEYTIQIEPEFLKSLADGEEIHSDVPHDAGQVQRVCIRIGTSAVRHTAASIQHYKRLLVSAPRYASSDPALASGEAQRTILWPSRGNPEESFGTSYGWQPDQNGNLAYYVQIDPTTLKTLAAGDEIHAAIDPAAGRVGQFVVVSGNKQLPRVAPPPAEVATVTPPPLMGNRTRFQTGDDAGAPAPTTMPPANRFRTGDYGAPPASPPSTGGYTGGTLLETPRTEYTPPPATRTPPTYYPPNEPAVADSRGFNGTSPAPANSGRFDQYRSGALQPPVDTAPPPTYVQPVAAEQPQYQQPNYQQPSYQQPPTRYSPPATGDRFASAPPPATTATNPSRTAEVEVPVAALTAPQAKDQWWWPYWLFVVFSLFLSIGGNLYLGWTAAEFYSRYRLAVDRLRTAGRA